MDFKKIFSFYNRNLSRNFMKTRLLPLIFGIFGGFMLIALILYPSPYNLINDVVSNLGDPLKNPSGWIFFSIAFWFLAIMLPSIFIYLHKRLLHLHGNITKIGTISNIISAIGMFLLGSFPSLPELYVFHIIAALLSFVGLVVGCICYWIAMIKEAWLKAVRYRHVEIVVILFLITVLFGLVLILGIMSLEILPWSLGFPFWEWTLLLTLTLQFVIFTLIIPEHFSPH